MSDENVEVLYDTYLDACYSGEAEDPEAFFVRHPGLDTTGRERIKALHRVVTESSEDEIPFKKLGGYKLLRRLGGGGMGTVYLAEQVALRRFVALKVIRPELQASAAGSGMKDSVKTFPKKITLLVTNFSLSSACR